MPTQKQSEPKEILGLNRITKKRILELCKRDKLYQTPRLNDVLYLHYQGFQNIECLEDYTELKCLWLECNAISEIQGLENQTKLKCLYLQSNLIRKIENLEFCKELDTINLSQNQIRKIENVGCDVLPVLNTLNIASNYIKDAEGLRDLENCKNLSVLDLSNNRIDDILVVKVFAKMPELKVLVLQGNPVVSKIPQYRKTLILECKKLTYLDQRPVFPKDRACAEAWKRGGYEEERKENERWNRQERRKMRDSVNATIRLRNKYRKPEDHMTLLVSSDSEDEATQQRRQRQQDVLDSGVDMELGIWDEVAGDDGHGAEVSPSSSSSQTDVSSSTSDSKESHENAPRRVNLEIETADDKYEVLDEMEKVMKTMDTEIQEPQRKPGDSSLLPESFFQKSEEKAENNLIETTETDDDVKDILKNAPRRVNLEIETADDKYEVLDEMDKVMKTMDTEIQKPQRKPDDSSLLPESFSQKSEEKAENNLIETTETDDDVKDILKNAPRRVNLEIEIADDKYEVLDEMDKVMKTMDTEIQEPQRKPDDSSLLPESFSQKSEEKALKADNDVKDILKIIEFLREQEILEQLFSQRQENDNSKMAPKEKCPSVIVKEKSELSGLKNESNIVQQQKPIQGENLDPYVEELKMEKSPTKFEDETIALEKNLKTEDILLKKIDINPVEMQENLPDSKLETATTKTEIQKNNPIQHQNLDSHVEEFKMEKIASKYENERSSLEEYPKEEKLEKIDNNPVNLQDDNSISPDMNYEANVFEDEIGEEYFSNEMHNKIVDIENFDSHVQECKMEKIATKYENERCALDENPKQEELETFDNNPVNLQDDDSISPDDFVCPDMNFEANVKEDKIGKECSSNEMHNKILDIENFDSHEEECKMEKIATEYENERSSFDENPKEEELEKIDNNPVNLQNDDFISPDNTISPDMNFEANVEEDKIGEECSSNGMHNKIVVIENFDSHVEEWKMEKIATKYEDERSSLDENLKEEELEKIDKNPVNLQDGDFISSDDFISPDMNFGANVNEDNIGKECFLNEMQNKIVNIANLDSHAEECKMEKVATKHEDESTALDENPKEDELETFDNNPVNPEESPTNFKLETATAIPSQNLLRDNNFEYKPLDMASLTRASNKAMDSLERETKELIALLQNLEEENEEKFKEIEFQEKEITENVDEKSYEDNVIMGENSEEQQGKEISYQSETESKEIKRDNKCQKLNPAETTSDIGSEGIKLGNNEEQFDEIDIKQTVLNIIYAATSSECSNIQSEDRKFSCYEIEKMEALTEDPDDVDISQEMDFDDNRQEMKVKENASQIGGEGCANENHNNTEDMKRKLNNKSGYDVSRDIGEGATSTKENNDEGILARDILENIIVEEMENNNKENGENHADCMSQEIHFEAIVKEDKIEEEGSLNEIHNKIKDMKEKLNDELGCDAPREITGYMRDIGEEAYSESATSIKENDDGRILERDILENIFVEGNENNNKDNGENHDDFISQEMNFEVNVKEDKIGEDKNFDEDKIEEEGCANEMNNKMTDMESKLNIEPEYDVPRETNENTRDDKDEVHGEIASSTKDNGVRSNESILEQDILERKNAGEIENNDKMLKIRGDDDSLTVKNNGENHDYFISQQMNFEANVKEDKIGEEGSSNEIHKKIKDMERKLNNELDYDVLRETNEDMSDNEENIHNESACSTEENDDECILQRNILVNKNVEESENNNKMLKIRGDDDSLAVKDNGENHDDFISEDMHFDGETHEHISNSVQFVEEILEESLEELFNENLYTTIEKDGIEIDENTEENVFDENMYESEAIEFETEKDLWSEDIFTESDMLINCSDYDMSPESEYYEVENYQETYNSRYSYREQTQLSDIEEESEIDEDSEIEDISLIRSEIYESSRSSNRNSNSIAHDDTEEERIEEGEQEKENNNELALVEAFTKRAINEPIINEPIEDAEEEEVVGDEKPTYLNENVLQREDNSNELAVVEKNTTRENNEDRVCENNFKDELIEDAEVQKIAEEEKPTHSNEKICQREENSNELALVESITMEEIIGNCFCESNFTDELIEDAEEEEVVGEEKPTHSNEQIWQREENSNELALVETITKMENNCNSFCESNFKDELIEDAEVQKIAEEEKPTHSNEKICQREENSNELALVESITMEEIVGNCFCESNFTDELIEDAEEEEVVGEEKPTHSNEQIWHREENTNELALVETITQREINDNSFCESNFKDEPVQGVAEEKVVREEKPIYLNENMWQREENSNELALVETITQGEINGNSFCESNFKDELIEDAEVEKIVGEEKPTHSNEQLWQMEENSNELALVETIIKRGNNCNSFCESNFKDELFEDAEVEKIVGGKNLTHSNEQISQREENSKELALGETITKRGNNCNSFCESNFKGCELMENAEEEEIVSGENITNSNEKMCHREENNNELAVVETLAKSENNGDSLCESNFKDELTEEVEEEIVVGGENLIHSNEQMSQREENSNELALVETITKRENNCNSFCESNFKDELIEDVKEEKNVGGENLTRSNKKMCRREEEINKLALVETIAKGESNGDSFCENNFKEEPIDERVTGGEEINELSKLAKIPQIPAIDANADEPKKNPLEMTKTKHLPLTKTIHDVLDSLADLFKGIPKKKRQKVHVSESDKSACLKKLAGQPQLKMFNQDTHESLDKQLNEFKEQQKIEIQQMVNRVYAQRERYDDSIELIDDKLMIVHKDTGELRELEKPKHIAYSDSDNNDYDTADEGACCSKPRKALDGEQSDVVKQQNSWKSIESDADGDEIVTTEKATDGSRDGKIFNFMENTPSKAPSIAAMNYKNPWYSIESGTDDEEQFHSLPPSSKSLNIFDNIHRDFFDKLSLDHLNFTPQDEDQIVQCSRSYTELRNLLIQLPAEEVFTQEERTLLESIKIGSSKTEDFPNLSQTEKHVQICQYTENNSKEVPVENTCEKEQHKESIASEHWYIGEENNEKKDNPYYKVLSNGVNVIFDAQRADVKTQTQDQEIQTEITLGTNSDFEHKNTEFKHQVESFQSQRNSSLDYSKNVPLKPDENIENYNSDILECNLEILDCNDGIVDNIMVNAEIHYEY
ncbi:protein PFC0760c isoform X2 [Musca domestica]|uniref:Dynein axonemal assembly factor 1 homolog n=1 Tax=Musca domestica TaxID=7370 RepID=A0ABM3VJM0_MUSDO|nr:protein PFC0760c isoform X2 [Musca domestica]